MQDTGPEAEGMDEEDDEDIEEEFEQIVNREVKADEVAPGCKPFYKHLESMDSDEKYEGNSTANELVDLSTVLWHISDMLTNLTNEIATIRSMMQEERRPKSV
jgi:hypothetical protein